MRIGVWALLVSLSFWPAMATTVTQFTDDGVFNGQCNRGVSNLDCESAVAELRSGNFSTNGDFEAALRAPAPPSGFINTDQRQIAWTSGTPVDFSLTHDGNAVLTFTVGSLAPMILDMTAAAAANSAVLPFSEVRGLFIRTRSQDPTLGETALLSDLELMNDDTGELVGLPNNSPVIGGSGPGAAYIEVTGFDFQAAWSLTGTSTFSFPNGTGSVLNSRLSHQFKLTDIPLPASLWGLVAALALLGGMARRRQPQGGARAALGTA